MVGGARTDQVTFVPRKAIKAQALADFITEWTDGSHRQQEDAEEHCWDMFFDGSYTLQGAGAGVVLISPKKEIHKFAIQLNFQATNNIAEYEGLVSGLKIARSLGVSRLRIKGDSQLVAKQFQKEFACKDEKMAAYLAEVRKLEKDFLGFNVCYIPRIDNQDADHLAWIASSRAPVPDDVIIQILTTPSITIKNEATPLTGNDIMIIDNQEPEEPEEDWRTPIKACVVQELSPGVDDAATQRMMRKARVYTVIDGELYKKGLNGMLMKCILRSDGIRLLHEIHGGVCGAHNSWRTLVGKTFRHGFYWPTAKQDAMELVKTCESCQFFQKQTTRHAQPLTTIPLSWPFAVWGIDILGPFPKAKGGFKFLFVAIDTFTKWIEAEPVRNITKEAAVKFLKGIVYRFGSPNKVMTDNGTQFTSKAWKNFCEMHHIHHAVSSAAHPQTNGQVERANGVILQGIKTRVYEDLQDKNTGWAEELSSVLWAARTNQNRATRESPFYLVYGTEAVLPPEVILRAPRVEQFREEDQTEAREVDLNCLEEVRNTALLRVEKYQQELRRQYQKKVFPRSFEVGDLVLKKDCRTIGKNKLSTPWEGPFIISEVAKLGAYVLAEVDGDTLQSTWNADQLRRFYV